MWLSRPDNASDSRKRGREGCCKEGARINWCKTEDHQQHTRNPFYQNFYRRSPLDLLSTLSILSLLLFVSPTPSRADRDLEERLVEVSSSLSLSLPLSRVRPASRSPLSPRSRVIPPSRASRLSPRSLSLSFPHSVFCGDARMGEHREEEHGDFSSRHAEETTSKIAARTTQARHGRQRRVGSARALRSSSRDCLGPLLLTGRRRRPPPCTHADEGTRAAFRGAPPHGNGKASGLLESAARGVVLAPAERAGV